MTMQRLSKENWTAAKETAKNYSIIDILNHYSLLTSKAGNKNKFKIKDPFTKDKTPSFAVNTVGNNNFAKSFSSGKSYDSIDFVQEYENLSFVEAVNKINALAGITPKAKHFSRQNFTKTAKPTTKASDLQPLTDKGKLTSLKYYYLKKERFISPSLAEVYGLQYFKSKKGKGYYLGVKTDTGAIECFNGLKDKDGKRTKLSFGSKSITTFPAKTETNDFTVFEAYLDFLSYLTLHGIQQLKTNVIILNGIEQTQDAITKIKPFKSSKIFLALDRDHAGDKAKEAIKNAFNCEIIELTEVYKRYKDRTKYKDINSVLQARKGIKL